MDATLRRQEHSGGHRRGQRRRQAPDGACKRCERRSVWNLLNGLIERAVRTGRDYLHVLDGAKALHAPIETVFSKQPACSVA